MSPTILRELLRIQTAVRAGDDAGWYEGNVAYYAPGVRELDAPERRAAAKRLLRDPSRLLRAEMPERRYHEAMDREYEEQRKAGGRELCPVCGTRSVVSDTVLTYGVPSNPNSEYSVYSRCENNDCDWEQI